jgi:hypothetical protein
MACGFDDLMCMGTVGASPLEVRIGPRGRGQPDEKDCRKVAEVLAGGYGTSRKPSQRAGQILIDRVKALRRQRLV